MQGIIGGLTAKTLSLRATITLNYFSAMPATNKGPILSAIALENGGNGFSFKHSDCQSKISVLTASKSQHSIRLLSGLPKLCKKKFY